MAPPAARSRQAEVRDRARGEQPPPLWTVEGLAAYLGVSPAVIYRWNSRGEGPPYLKVGRHCRYRPADVDNWLDAHAAS